MGGWTAVVVGNPEDETPLSLERSCWRGVVEGRALEVYRRVMASDARVFLPERHFDRQAALTEWVPALHCERFRFVGERTLPITDRIALTTYDVVAEHARGTETSRCSSLYVRQHGAWRLTLHQRELVVTAH